MTHDELVKLAFNWLRRRQRCSLVVSELVAGIEVPDAIGWRGALSILIECKVSIADLRADLRKGFRDRRTGLGIHRFYMVTPDIEDKALEIISEGWGLLVPDGKRMRMPRDSQVFSPDRRGEIFLMLSIIRRLAGRNEPLDGVGVKCYRHDFGLQAATPARAVLSVEMEPDPKSILLVSGQVQKFNSEERTLTLWFDGIPGIHTVPVRDNMPAWLLCSGASFEAKVSYSALRTEEWEQLEWWDIGVKPYTDLTEDELLQEIEKALLGNSE